MQISRPDWVVKRAEWYQEVHRLFPTITDRQVFDALGRYYDDHDLKSPWDSAKYINKYLGISTTGTTSASTISGTTTQAPKQGPEPNYYFLTKDFKTCIDDYQIVKELNKGVFGTVSEACQGSNCNYVTKVIDFSTAANIQTTIRDIYFLNLLQSITLDKLPLVPQIIDYWLCRSKQPDKFILVMDKWDTDGRQYLKKNKIVSLAVIVRMFLIATALGQLGIVHGDLKPDQFLIKFAANGDKKAVPQVCITDFGLAGGYNTNYEAFMGWSESQYGCTAAYTPIKYQDPNFAINFNLFQLEAMFLFWYPTFVDLGPDGTRRFVGLKNFEQGRQSIRSVCFNYAKEANAQIEKLVGAQAQAFDLDYNVLVKQTKSLKNAITKEQFRKSIDIPIKIV